VPELERLWSRNAEERLYAAFEQGLGVLPDDVDCEPQIVRGPAGRVLVALADRPDDLLVVGAGRHGRLPRAAHTRIAGYCIARAACCVVAVPPPPLAGVSRRLKTLTV
jgi:nucleotide-binding universal stress UspA family protein